MPKSAAERMVELRARQRQAGLTTLTVVVPRGDGKRLVQWAKHRREEWAKRRFRARLPVSLPQISGVARSAVKSEDVRRLRELIEVTAVGLVIERMTPRIEQRLRTLVARGASMTSDTAASELQRFHLALGEMSADKTLHFLLRVALHITTDRTSFPLRPRRERDAVVSRIKMFHGLIVEAILARDRQRAERQMRRYLSGLKDWLD